MTDSFFDCLNTRILNEADRKRKSFLKPYISINDERLTCLNESFLKYILDSKENIETRPGDFTKTARRKMFMSWQTYEGLKLLVFQKLR